MSTADGTRESSDDYEQLLDDFENCWLSGAPPEFSHYLPSADAANSSEQRFELLNELIKIDLEYRWRRESEDRQQDPQTLVGTKAPDIEASNESSASVGGDSTIISCDQFGPYALLIEDYLRTFPELHSDDETLVDLIGEEFRVRCRFGDNPNIDGYRARFPKLESRLQSSLASIAKELHRESGSSTQIGKRYDEASPNGKTLRDLSDSEFRDAETIIDAQCGAEGADLNSDSRVGDKAINDHARFLLTIRPFSELPIEVANSIAVCVKEHEFATGDVLLHQGGTATHLTILTDGIVEVNLLDDNNEYHVLDRDSRGGVLGEIALLTGHAHSANVVAVSTVRALLLDVVDFDRIAKQFPSLNVAFAHLIATRVGRQQVDVFYDKTINGYRIKRRLGVGAMAVVYEAEESAAERSVALKMMSHRLAYDHEAVSRFHREAEIVASLDCENIVKVYNCFSAYNTSFIAMELCDGPTLSQLIRHNPMLPESQVRAIIGQLAAALVHAHGKGVVHRDVKPANVMLLRDGTLKLSDFGLAKSFVAPGLTNLGQILGTPRYMPPEQLVGTDVDHRADIYALGCITYELLMGEPLFCESDTMKLLRQQLDLSLDESVKTITEQRKDYESLSEDLIQILRESINREKEERTLDLATLTDWSDKVDHDLIELSALEKTE